MNTGEAIAYLLTLVLLAGSVLRYRRKSERYGGYSDPVKFRVSFIRTTGFHRKRPEDGLYDDDGRINRHWKP